MKQTIKDSSSQKPKRTVDVVFKPGVSGFKKIHNSGLNDENIIAYDITENVINSSRTDKAFFFPIGCKEYIDVMKFSTEAAIPRETAKLQTSLANILGAFVTIDYEITNNEKGKKVLNLKIYIEGKLNQEAQILLEQNVDNKKLINLAKR